MSRDRLPPPDSAICLIRPYPSTQKGGTLIAEEVTDRDAHQRRLCDPDGYRPEECPGCAGGVLHVHDYRERTLRGEAVDPEAKSTRAKVVRYLCVACRATWQVLPRFLARHLWRTWRVVESQTVGAAPSTQPPVPEATLHRWWGRLRSAARDLVEVLAQSGSPSLEELAQRIGLDGTRERLVRAHADEAGTRSGEKLADLAALVHRLEPGVRLM